MTQSLNMVRILQEKLGEEVKKAMTEKLVEYELKGYEKKLRESIKPIVEKITFDGIENVKDIMRMREELHIFLHWTDSKTTVCKRL